MDTWLWHDAQRSNAAAYNLHVGMGVRLHIDLRQAVGCQGFAHCKMEKPKVLV